MGGRAEEGARPTTRARRPVNKKKVVAFVVYATRLCPRPPPPGPFGEGVSLSFGLRRPSSISSIHLDRPLRFRSPASSSCPADVERVRRCTAAAVTACASLANSSSCSITGDASLPDLRPSRLSTRGCRAYLAAARYDKPWTARVYASADIPSSSTALALAFARVFRSLQAGLPRFRQLPDLDTYQSAFNLAFRHLGSFRRYPSRRTTSDTRRLEQVHLSKFLAKTYTRAWLHGKFNRECRPRARSWGQHGLFILAWPLARAAPTLANSHARCKSSARAAQPPSLHVTLAIENDALFSSLAVSLAIQSSAFTSAPPHVAAPLDLSTGFAEPTG